MAAEVPQTLEYRGGKLNAAPLLEVENFINWKKRFICHVIESELAYVFGKIKYEENLIDIIYDNENKKALTTPTPLSTAFISTSIVEDFQDSPDDEEDTRSSQEYLNELKEEYQARALLAKSKSHIRLATTTPYIIRMYAFTISIANLVADSSFYLIIIDFPTCKFQSRIISAGKEVDIGLDRGRDKALRLTDMLLYSWDKGLDVCVDLTGSSPLPQTGLVDFVSDRAVIEAAQHTFSVQASFGGVTSNLMRIRAMASSSCFYNTRCFKYDKRDSEDVSILKCDSKPGSMVHHAVNHAYI
ncbi:hypothetical protein Tco_0065698 [Tanacetum coccineum]